MNSAFGFYDISINVINTHTVCFVHNILMTLMLGIPPNPRLLFGAQPPDVT